MSQIKKFGLVVILATPPILKGARGIYTTNYSGLYCLSAKFQIVTFNFLK